MTMVSPQLGSALRHPGPPARDRRQAVPAHLRQIEGRIEAGRVLMDEVARLFDEADLKGGVLWLNGVIAAPFRYVLPALSTDGVHAAYYSETHAPDGEVILGNCVAIVGWRDGKRFLHCHGDWRKQDGEVVMGHLLPLESRVAAPVTLRGMGAREAWFDAVPDPETNFTLFSADGKGVGSSLLLRLRPGEDVVTAVAEVAAAHGVRQARVHGIGSICNPVFSDGRQVDCVATEVRIDAGEVFGNDCSLAVSLVDVDGHIHSGELMRGVNIVGVTFEIIIENGDSA